MMTNQIIRSTLLGLVVIALAAFFAGPANADGAKKVDMKFAGALLLNLEQQQVDANGQPINETEFTGIAQAKAVGSLGKADVNVATKAGPPMSGRACPDGFFPIADITDNSIIFTFSDLSLLYGDGQGVVCLSIDGTKKYVSVHGTWLGGTRRFAHSRGEFKITTDKLVDINPNTQFSAESGHITGFLRRPDRDE